MDITLNGGTQQQQQWFNEAIRAITYPLDSVDAEVTVEWPDEPSLPGHSEYACTHVTGTVALIEIRKSLDTVPDSLITAAELKDRYFDVVAHEIGHVVHFTRYSLGQREGQCPLFFYDGPDEGERNRVGTPDDLNPSAKVWADRIQEGYAEVWKDSFLPSALRFSDNRTNWRIAQSSWVGLFAVPDDTDITPFASWTLAYTPMPGGT